MRNKKKKKNLELNLEFLSSRLFPLTVDLPNAPVRSAP